MTKKKVFALIISLALVLSVVISGTLAAYADDAADGGPAAEKETVIPTPDAAQTPEPTEEPGSQEPPVPSEVETPDETETPTECTCGAAEGEAHQEGCPLYQAPEAEQSGHIDTCDDGCEDPFCTCPCHLFDRLMACRTLEEAEALIAATPEEALMALTAEQVALIEAHMESLMPAPLPAIVIEESEPPVESEICRPTVNYTYVAPFGEPVTGGR